MKIYHKFRDFCNANKGVFEFLALILLIISLIPLNSINLKAAGTFFENVLLVITYNIKIPVYVILILLILAFIYFRRTKSKYKTSKRQNINFDFLVGTWKNEWITNSKKASEICKITPDGRYFTNNIHYFDIKDLKVDASTGKITFSKVSILPNDNRVLYNELNIVNNSRLEGKENDIKISYTKIN